MGAPVTEKLEIIKNLIENGRIRIKGINKGMDPLETDEVKYFLKIAEDILKVDALSPKTNTPIADLFIKKLQDNNLTINFHAKNTYYAPETERINFATEKYNTFYIDLKTGNVLPLTAYQSHTHELCHFILSGETKDGLHDENLTVKLTDKTMETHGEPHRDIYTTSGYIKSKELRELFKENKEDLKKFDPNGYNDFNKPAIELGSPKDLSLFYYNLTTYIDRAENPQYREGAVPDIYKEEFEKILDLERRLYGDKEALISLVDMAKYIDLNTYKADYKYGIITPEEKELILNKAKSIEGIQINEKDNQTKITLSPTLTLKL